MARGSVPVHGPEVGDHWYKGNSHDELRSPKKSKSDAEGAWTRRPYMASWEWDCIGSSIGSVQKQAQYPQETSLTHCFPLSHLNYFILLTPSPCCWCCCWFLLHHQSKSEETDQEHSSRLSPGVLKAIDDRQCESAAPFQPQPDPEEGSSTIWQLWSTTRVHTLPLSFPGLHIRPTVQVRVLSSTEYLR